MRVRFTVEVWLSGEFLHLLQEGNRSISRSGSGYDNSGNGTHAGNTSEHANGEIHGNGTEDTDGNGCRTGVGMSSSPLIQGLDAEVLKMVQAEMERRGVVGAILREGSAKRKERRINVR